MSFLGCDGSKSEPAPQPTGDVATQVVATVTSAALPTGTVAVAAKPAEAKSVPVEKKPKQLLEPEVGGINMNGLRSIEVKVSDTPDLTAFMEYMEIVPNPGMFSTSGEKVICPPKASFSSTRVLFPARRA